tara:strand:+ start:193 stop:1740 length:1548 start_codon:yes stop_codon:yes gene_type:complete
MKTAPIEIITTQHQHAAYVMKDGAVSLTVYPRVHMFTFDLSLIAGILRHGSMGYSLKNMPIEIVVRKSESSEDSVKVAGGVDVKQLDFAIDLDKLRAYINSEDHYDVFVSVNRSIREHTGLGLSTQILGGIYLCSAKVSGRDLTISDLFSMGIGHYSALGLNLLFNPGMIFEMGCKPADEGKGFIVNPTLSQIPETVANTVYKVNDFPFYTIVAIPKDASSISGQYEIDFWTASLPDKDEDSYRIVYNVFEKVITGIIEHDSGVFIEALKENITLGSKPLEESVQSDRTKEVLGRMRDVFDFAAVSSLGPALYAFSSSDPSHLLSKLNISDYDLFVYGPDGGVKKKMNSADTLLIASFASMGKTTFAQKHPDVALDIESIDYARIYSDRHPNDEVAKGEKNWIDNPDYPENYTKAVLDNLGKYRVIFLTLGKDILTELDKHNLKYTILYPGPNRKHRILSDSKRRGNDAEFVDFLDSLLSTPDHRLALEGVRYEHFDIIDDNSYIEAYLDTHYYL